MKKLQKLLQEITQLTYIIETNYPELYRNLEENPITIPSDPYSHIDSKTLEGYLESLRELFRHHLETHPVKP